MSELEIPLNAFPPPGPPPNEGSVHLDPNQEPEDIYETPSLDNNAVSGVVIDQNETPPDERGPHEDEPEVEEARKRQVEPQEHRLEPLEEGEEPDPDPNTINTVNSVYASPKLDFTDPEGLEEPEPGEEIPTRPPEWVDEGEEAGVVPVEA